MSELSPLGCYELRTSKWLQVIYAVQQDTQSGLMSKFYSALMLARHVSDLIGALSGAFCTSCICRLRYVVLLCVILE